MNKLFKNVGGSHVGRSMFNLSYEKLLTCDMGELIPILCEECVPSDVWKIANKMIIRMTPLVAPILHMIDVFVHYFFVPYRILWDEWELFITGGPDGDYDKLPPKLVPVVGGLRKGQVEDYLGFPPGLDLSLLTVAGRPSRFPVSAYAKIFNEFYRDQNLQDEVDIDTFKDDLLIRNWEKDYFTSALPFQQRGQTPALPVSGVSSAVWDVEAFVTNLEALYSIPLQADNRASENAGFDNLAVGKEYARENLIRALNANTVTLDDLATFDVSDLRLAFQIQKWMERNARAGVRYTEFLRAHFGVNPRDDRLQRPEYIGGSKCPLIISEVLQTSQTDTTPQGTMRGHGIGVSQEFICNYHVQEYGLVMGIMSIMPKPMYQQGVNRQWLRNSRFDHYFSEFAHLSEQEIKTGEIFFTEVDEDNDKMFGFCGAYDEMRVKNNMVCADFRDTFSYWHIGRIFEDAPELNESFIQCVPRKDIFADQADDAFLIQFGNLLHVLRPMPIIAEPGLIDHG